MSKRTGAPAPIPPLSQADEALRQARKADETAAQLTAEALTAAREGRGMDALRLREQAYEMSQQASYTRRGQEPLSPRGLAALDRLAALMGGDRHAAL